MPTFETNAVRLADALELSTAQLNRFMLEHKCVVPVFEFAYAAHQEYVLPECNDGNPGPHLRKEGTLYITHPISVATRAILELEDVLDEAEMIVAVKAALLHDVVEDTEFTIADVLHVTGDQIVADVVEALTKVEQPGLNRAGRKELTRAKLRDADYGNIVHSLKSLDITDNAGSIGNVSKNSFALLWYNESLETLSVLTKAVSDVRLQAFRVILKELEDL